MKTDGRVVNYSGIIRGSAQQLVKLELAGRQSDQLITRLDRIVNGLILGDEQFGLPKITDQTFLGKMNEVQRAWTGLKESIMNLRDNPTLSNTFLETSEDFFKLTNSAVSSAENYGVSNIETLQIIQWSLLVLSLVAAVALLIMDRNLRVVLEKTINVISSTATAIAATASEHEHIVKQQFSSLNETTATMELLGVSSHESAKQAQSAEAETQRVLTMTEEGTGTVEQTLDGMESLREKTEIIGKKIHYLSDQTNTIGEITNLVSDFSDQTNLLALNAAVVAARAGEHGKGFAVVAGEIRKLADQSKGSTEKIHLVVEDIQKNTKASVLVTEEESRKVEEGTQLVRKVAEMFHKVDASVGSTSDSVRQISLNVQRQAVAIKQVGESMNDLNAGAKEILTGIIQNKEGILRLNEHAQKLKAIV